LNAPFLSVAAGTPVLRVLSGRLRGAEHRLHPGKFVRIGHGFDHDIVLRDATTRGLSIELHLGEEMANVRVVAGQIGLLGRPIAAGEQVALPAYVPMMLGGFAVAIGDPASERWEESTRLSSMIAPAGEAQEVAPQRAALGERVATRLYPMRGALALDRQWPLYAALAAMLLLLVALAGPAAKWVSHQLHDEAADQAMLAAAGFGDLTITDGPAGPVIRGIVKDDAALARLRLVVAQRMGLATLDVDTMDGLAAAATDLLRAQGIDGEALPRRGNALLVTAEFLPADRQAELVKLIKEDVPGVSRVLFAADPARGDRDLQYFFSGSEYGLATFVDGNPGYITTADGTRWFPGAQVPTGHRIVTIGNGRASFERNGQIEELVLGPQTPPAPGQPVANGGAANGGTTS
jgi:type III secretion system YscD/HrpQ family protein